ncbi:MAG TPA: undecaprenyl-diphosphate phosphatase [Solirubrobacteraceae bacterium]|nr:undecaprenyl-diphosphate phosphatase [Solirubrobacteraceae bacterium]
MPRSGADAATDLPLRHAVALGLVHGPAELLPVSSSAHVSAIPLLLRWPYPALDPELRKAFEVALHAGTAAALLVALRGEVADAARDLDARRLAIVAGSFAPPAVAGLLFERQIERRLGTARTLPAGLLGGAAALALADARGDRRRRREDAGGRDALWLGVAQACALIPGASRNGMTLAAARLRGFRRPAASVLSRHVALPVIIGATVLKGVRLVRRGVPRQVRAPFAAGVVASFASTLAAARLLPLDADRPLWPYAAYRALLAAALAARDGCDLRRTEPAVRPPWRAERPCRPGARPAGAARSRPVRQNGRR